MSYKSDLNDYELIYVTQTDLAIGVTTEEGGDLIWLPKSQIQYEDDDYSRDDEITVTVPDWLAREHDLM
jgi:hypothetical protein